MCKTCRPKLFADNNVLKIVVHLQKTSRKRNMFADIKYKMSLRRYYKKQKQFITDYLIIKITIASTKPAALLAICCYPLYISCTPLHIHIIPKSGIVAESFTI